MTIRGILLAGGWRNEAEVKTWNNDELFADLVNVMANHSNNDAYYYSSVNKDELIGKVAIVVFLLKLHQSSIGHRVYNKQRLKAWGDDQRNTIIAENYQHTRIPVPDLQGMTNQNLVRLALEWSLIAAEKT
jgi:hypothetical protein